VPKHAADAGDRCLRIIKSIGSRAKNLNYLGERFNPLLVCAIWGDSTDCLATAVAPSLWIVSRYFREDATMASIDTEFETVWGWKACEISETWRMHNDARKLEAGQSQKRITTRGSSIGRHLSEVRTLGPSSTSSIVPLDDSDDPPQQSSSAPSRLHKESDSRTLPSLKAVGLLDTFEPRRGHGETRSTLPPLSKSREW
jgi:hypothetical protein